MGHRAPYIAVITLSVLTAYHWRTIRLKLIQSGVHDPMKLTTMHILLDTTETAILETFAMSQEKDSEMKKTQFLDRLYSPMADPFTRDKPARIPGFEEDQVEASFDAFAAAAAAR